MDEGSGCFRFAISQRGTSCHAVSMLANQRNRAHHKRKETSDLPGSWAARFAARGWDRNPVTNCSESVVLGMIQRRLHGRSAIHILPPNTKGTADARHYDSHSKTAETDRQNATAGRQEPPANPEIH